MNRVEGLIKVFNRKLLGRSCSLVLLLTCYLLGGVEETHLRGAELTAEDKRLLSNSITDRWYSVEKSQEASVHELVGEKSIDVSDRFGGVEINSKAIAPNSNNYSNNTNNNFRGWFPDWLRLLLAPVMEIAVYLIGALLVVILGIGIWAMFSGKKMWFTQRKGKSSQLNQLRDQIHITDLPFELAVTNLSLLEQSDYFRDRNDFSKAMVYFFSHVLVELNEAGLIQLARGKTNRLYLREVGGQTQIRQFLKLNVEKFERVFFGKHEIDAAGFNIVREQLQDFEGWLNVAKSDFVSRSNRSHD